MTNDKFNEIVASFMSFFQRIEKTKGKEYANGEDRLGNFKREAAKLGVEPETVCHIYMAKHADSIDHHVKTIQATGKLPDETAEPMHGRFGDHIVYLMLLYALTVERAEAEKRQAETEKTMAAVKPGCGGDNLSDVASDLETDREGTR